MWLCQSVPVGLWKLLEASGTAGTLTSTRRLYTMGRGAEAGQLGSHVGFSQQAAPGQLGWTGDILGQSRLRDELSHN